MPTQRAERPHLDSSPPEDAAPGDGPPGDAPPGDATPGDDTTGGRWRRLARLPRSADVWVAAVFLLAALWVTARLWAHLGGRIARAQSADEVLMEWMLGHGAWLFHHPQNPFFTHQLGVPQGANLMANNALLGLALPLAPLTMWLGAHTTFLVATIGCLAGSAYAWYHVLSRHFGTSRTAAFLGGAVAGFGPGIIAHAGGQLNLIAGFLLPFIVWRTLDFQTRTRVRNGVILGLLVTYQVFLSEEPLFTTAIALGTVLAIHAALRWHQVRPLVPRLLTNLGISAAVAGPLLAYPLWYQFRGPQHFNGMMRYVTDYSMDLDAYLRLPVQSLGGNPSLAGNVNGGPEQNAYLGIGLTIIMVVILVRFWKDIRIRATLLTAAALAVLSLGPTIKVHNVGASAPGPYRLLRGLPLFDSLVPARLGLVVTVLCAVALALSWDHIASPEHRALRPAWVVTLLVALAPLAPTPMPVLPSTPVPAFISTGMWRQYLDQHHSLLTFPVPTIVFPEGMRWSAAAQQEFSLANGYFLSPTSTANRTAAFGPPERTTTNVVNTVALSKDPRPVTEELRRQVFADLRYWHAGLVVVGPGRHEKDLRDLAEHLFGPGRQIGGVWIWDVHAIADADA